MTSQQLEDLVDAQGIHAVLEMLGEICHAKADHLRSNWQDEEAARRWEGIARRLGAIDEDGDADTGDADGPAEDDYVTEDHRHFFQGGRLALTVADGEDFRAALREHMDMQGYWPGVWFISDHGNAHPIDMQT